MIGMYCVDPISIISATRRLSFSGFATGLILFLLTGCGKEVDGTTDNKRLTALGEVMAEKTTALCSNGGNVVLLIDKNDQTTATPYGQTVAAFRKTLGQSAKVVATEGINIPASIAPGIEPFSAVEFSKVLEKYATADYLISFVGLPRLTPEQITQLPSPRPKTIVVITHSQPAQIMFQQNVACLAAVPKILSDETLADIHSSRTWSAQELFDAQYETVK